ncbi:MAG: hypothetical protein ABJO57_00740 [Lentilitoribacter sp.]
MELVVFGNLSPFFIALAILVVLKFKLWRNVETINWPQRICGLILPPVAMFCMFLLFILIGNLDDATLGLTVLFIMFYLALASFTFAVLVLFIRTKSFRTLLAIAIATHLLYLFGQYLSNDNPNRAANLLDYEVLSVFAINSVIFAGTYWAYIKNWPRIDLQSKIDPNE